MILRDRGDDGARNYELQNELFSLKVHHGGEFIQIPQKVYMGGECDHIDCISCVEMSMKTMEQIGKLLGFHDCTGFYYRVPETDDDKGLIFVLIDSDTTRIAEYGRLFKEVEVFLCVTFSNMMLEDCDVQDPLSGDLFRDSFGQQGQIVDLGDDESSEGESLHDSDNELGGEEDSICVENIDHEAEWGNIGTGYESMIVDRELQINDSSEEYGSDDLHSLCSDDDENRVKIPKFPRFNPDIDKDDPQFRIGMRFTNAKEFKEAMGDLMEKVQRDMNIDISRNTYYRTKERVWGLLYGQYKEQYTRLHDYCQEIRDTNPGSTVQGFKDGCRPIVGVDGCHLRGIHKGVLLTAVGLDPNNCIFPICYCVAEDRQKGLLPAIYELLPNVEHRYCVLHMYNNFKKDHSGLALKDMIWKAVRATYMNQFKGVMDSLKETTPKSDILLNNMSGTFNSVIKHARSKPLLSMVEMIRIYLMKRMQSNREFISKYVGPICPKVQKTLEKLKDNRRACISAHAGSGKFEVRDMYDGRYVVDIERKTCSCRKWELTGIPCVHGVCCIASFGRVPEDYVHEFHSTTMYQKAYKYIINPVRGPHQWPQTGTPTVSGPGTIRLPGRPIKARRKEPDEIVSPVNGTTKLTKTGQKKYCKGCGKDGHNISTCPSKKNNVEPVEVVNDRPGGTASEEPVEAVEIESSKQGNTINEQLVDAARPKKKFRCSVCLKEGHKRNKCDAPAARIWKNMDFYAPNHQHIPQEIEIDQEQNLATQASIKENQNVANFGGVSLKADFIRQGKQCVTLRSLQSAARSKVAGGATKAKAPKKALESRTTNAIGNNKGEKN
ncbi:hypothetical protein BUALT_Bualt08G0081700 [Buddleja alternifolia]|uniref:SWIM-type domain-containing protein n=1 Tax=Buddleja alternifolia TaxID=168488 RepID=A0AAV6X534_9LAMI|nr:hypothetical protein BUALT_Bualt08G0081700 [Buddleja alternifolia]